MSADIDQLAWCCMRPAIERLTNRLIPRAEAGERVRAQQRRREPSRPAVKVATNEYRGSREKRDPKGRPDPAQRLDDRTAGRPDKKPNSGHAHETGGQGRPALRLLGPKRRMREEHPPTRRTREEDCTCSHVIVRSAQRPDGEDQGSE